MREAPSQEAFLARLEQEGLGTYSREGKLTGVELDGKKYRFKRTIGVDLEQHEWRPPKNQDKEVETHKEQVVETPTIESIPIAEIEVTPTDLILASPKEEPVQNPHESIPTREAEESKAPTEDLPKESPLEGPINPHHSQRSSELNSLRVQRKIGRDRADKDDNDGFRR
jgi:hypothetical protein